MSEQVTIDPQVVERILAYPSLPPGVKLARFRRAADPTASAYDNLNEPVLEISLPVADDGAVRAQVVAMLQAAEQVELERFSAEVKPELDALATRLAEQRERVTELAAAAARARREAEDALTADADAALAAEEASVKAEAALTVARRQLDKLDALHTERTGAAADRLADRLRDAVSSILEHHEQQARDAHKKLCEMHAEIAALQFAARAAFEQRQRTPRTLNDDEAHRRRTREILEASLER